MVTIPPILVRRLKSHFITLPCGVDLILGLNGYIWVSKHVKERDQEGEEGFDAEAVYSNQNDVCNLSLILFWLRSLTSLLPGGNRRVYPNCDFTSCKHHSGSFVSFCALDGRFVVGSI